MNPTSYRLVTLESDDISFVPLILEQSNEDRGRDLLPLQESVVLVCFGLFDECLCLESFEVNFSGEHSKSSKRTNALQLGSLGCFVNRVHKCIVVVAAVLVCETIGDQTRSFLTNPSFRPITTLKLYVRRKENENLRTKETT